MSALLLLRFVALVFFGLLGWRGEGAGVDDGRDAVARIRRSETRLLKASSLGREYSSRKKGCRERFCEGEGDRTRCGVEFWLEVGVSKPSISWRILRQVKTKLKALCN
jgi:hypothetical protein